MRDRIVVLLCVVLPGAILASIAAVEVQASDSETTTLDAIRVTAPLPRLEDLYRSRRIERTPPTVFDKVWRDPINLQKIGDEGGVIPLLVNYTARTVAEGARKLPGWKGPDQPAVARSSPLDEAQLSRAVRQQSP